MDSQMVRNSAPSASSSAEEKRDILRTKPYAPAMLKRQGMWQAGKLKSPQMFGKLGVALGHQGAESAAKNAAPTPEPWGAVSDGAKGEV